MKSTEVSNPELAGHFQYDIRDPGSSILLRNHSESMLMVKRLLPRLQSRRSKMLHAKTPLKLSYKPCPLSSAYISMVKLYHMTISSVAKQENTDFFYLILLVPNNIGFLIALMFLNIVGKTVFYQLTVFATVLPYPVSLCFPKWEYVHHLLSSNTSKVSSS